MPRAFQRYRKSFDRFSGDSSPEHNVSLGSDTARSPEASRPQIKINFQKNITPILSTDNVTEYNNPADQFYNLTKLAEVAERLSQSQDFRNTEETKDTSRNNSNISENTTCPSNLKPNITHAPRILNISQNNQSSYQSQNPIEQNYPSNFHKYDHHLTKSSINQECRISTSLDQGLFCHKEGAKSTYQQGDGRQNNVNVGNLEASEEPINFEAKDGVPNKVAVIEYRYKQPQKTSISESSEDDTSNASSSSRNFVYEHKIFDKIARKNKSSIGSSSSKSDPASETESSDRDDTKKNNQQLEEAFACTDCGKRYSTSSNLARHRQTHRSASDAKARRCPHCDKVYVSVPAYSMHVRTHARGCACTYCGKRFSRPWLLQGHIRTHTGEKPFKCSVCSKAFADKSNLRAHVQTHSNTKPHVCTRCGKAFALKSYLYKHEESSCVRQTSKTSNSVAENNKNDWSRCQSVITKGSSKNPMIDEEMSESFDAKAENQKKTLDDEKGYPEAKNWRFVENQPQNTYYKNQSTEYTESEESRFPEAHFSNKSKIYNDLKKQPSVFTRSDIQKSQNHFYIHNESQDYEEVLNNFQKSNEMSKINNYDFPNAVFSFQNQREENMERCGRRMGYDAESSVQTFANCYKDDEPMDFSSSNLQVKQIQNYNDKTIQIAV